MTPTGLRLRHAGSLSYVRFAGMEGEPGLVQAVFSRHGGVSAAPYASLNTSLSVGDDPAAVAENRRRAMQALDWGKAAVQGARQVHGSRVALVAGPGEAACPPGDAIALVIAPGGAPPEADALVTTERGVALTLRFADCVPVLLYDPMRECVGLAHAGWRGTAEAVAAATVRAMRQAFASRPADLLAGIGPSIGPCCYEVSRGLLDVFRPRFTWWHEVVDDRRGRLYLDLWQANARQLLEAGVTEDHIEAAGICTACHTGDWYSHRAEGGRTGRFSAVLGMRA